jgi:hypothetical protein
MRTVTTSAGKVEMPALMQGDLNVVMGAEEHAGTLIFEQTRQMDKEDREKFSAEAHTAWSWLTASVMLAALRETGRIPEDADLSDLPGVMQEIVNRSIAANREET